MKVFLCKGKRISFTFPRKATWERKDEAVWQRRRKVEVNLITAKADVTPYLEEGNSSQNDWRKQIINVWPKCHSPKTLDLVQQHQHPSDLASLKVTLNHVPGGYHPLIRHDQLSIHVQGKLLQDIRIALGVQDVRLQMELFDARVQSSKGAIQVPKPFRRFEPMVNVLNEMIQHFNQQATEKQPALQHQVDAYWTKCHMDMPLKSVQNDLRLAFCEEQIALPKAWRQSWLNFSDDTNDDLNDVEFSVKTNLLISVEEPEIHANKTFMMESKFEDAVEIVASNGKVVSCNGLCIKGQSGLLKIIIEENGNKLSLTDMSEQGVKAFVAYMYCKDLSVPMQIFSVAVELFQIAQKYSISHMELEMKNVLIWKPYLWFDDVNFALRLLLFVAKIPAHSDLKLKTLRVLKSMPVDVVVKSQIYQQLFQENQQVPNKLDDVKQLCDALLTLPMVDIMALSKL